MVEFDKFDNGRQFYLTTKKNKYETVYEFNVTLNFECDLIFEGDLDLYWDLRKNNDIVVKDGSGFNVGTYDMNTENYDPVTKKLRIEKNKIKHSYDFYLTIFRLNCLAFITVPDASCYTWKQKLKRFWFKLIN